MKIDDREPVSIPKLDSQGPSGALKPDTASVTSGDQSQNSGDQVDLGRQGQFVSLAQTAGSGERAKYVEGLRALAQSGQYDVDAGDLSQAIVGDALNKPGS